MLGLINQGANKHMIWVQQLAGQLLTAHSQCVRKLIILALLLMPISCSHIKACSYLSTNVRDGDHEGNQT